MSYQIKLEVFEGPMDLLLHLIKKHELDIYAIPIALITQQYLEYIELMKSLDMEIAGDFLVVASTLTHIKSKMLLPPAETPENEEEGLDPRAELIRRLLEYKSFKDAAGSLDLTQEFHSNLRQIAHNIGAKQITFTSPRRWEKRSGAQLVGFNYKLEVYMNQFDLFDAFLNWWMTSRPLKPPFSNDLLMIDGLANGAVIYRDGQFQVQMFIIQPLTEIVGHVHPNMDSDEVYLGGDIEFYHSGEKCTDMKNLHEIHGVCLEFGKVIRVRPNDVHGGKFGEKGGLFLSVQHWINGATPTSANIEWKFAEQGRTKRYESLGKE